MSLSKKQKDFLKTIENPKYKKYQKQQFKLQNKFYKFGLVEEIIFIDGIFKTDNPKLIAFFNECPMVEKTEENSLTKESLRDITEPKAESLINKEAPKGKNILSEDLLFSENKKLDISIEVFIKDCEKWLLHDLDFGTCIGIKNRCVSFNQFELASKFRDKEIQILSKFDEEKLNSFLQQGFIDLNTMVQVKKLSKSDNQNIPKEFCVEITEENKEVLDKLWRDFHKGNVLTGLYPNNYLHSNSLFTYCVKSNNYTLDDVKKEDVVSTEEFLRYIGKENMINSWKGFPVISSFPIHDEAGNPHKYLADEAGLFDFRPKRNHSLGEIADKVAELALEKISKTPDEPKHLDFDLHKKEYTIEDMEKCFNEGRRLNPMNGIKRLFLYSDFKKYKITLK